MYRILRNVSLVVPFLFIQFISCEALYHRIFLFFLNLMTVSYAVQQRENSGSFWTKFVQLLPYIQGLRICTTV